MRRILAVLVLSLWSSMAVAGGALASIDVKDMRLGDLLRYLSDTGKVNIVPLVDPGTKVDVAYKRVAWDTVLAGVVKRMGLASLREGSVVLVGDSAAIADLEKIKHRYRGPRVELDFHEASDAAVAALLARLGAVSTLTGGTRSVTLYLRSVPLDQALDVLALVTGATTSPTGSSKSPSGCAASKRPSKGMRVAGIGRLGIQRYAVVVDGPEVVVIRKGDCLGSDALRVKEVGAGSITFATPELDHSWTLHPPLSER